MADYASAVSSIRRLAMLYRDMEVAAEVLEKIGSGEQAVAEVTRALDKVRGELADTQDKVDEANAQVVQAERAADKVIAAANGVANEVIEKAKSEAEDILAEAKSEAEAVRGEVLHAAEAERAELVDEIELHRGDLTSLDDEIASKRKELEAAVTALAGAQAKLDAMRKAAADVLKD